MPPPTASLRPTPGSGAGNAKSTKTSIPPTGAATPTSTNPKDASSSSTANASANVNKLQRPDQDKYHKEQDGFKGEIDVVQGKLNAIKSRLDLLHAPSNKGGDAGASNDRRNVIRREMDEIQEKQGVNKADRQNTLNHIKKLQEQVATKGKEVKVTRDKFPYKNEGEVEGRISQLNKQVESGTLTLLQEKKSLSEISTLRRSLKSLTALTTLEDSIASDKSKIDELKKELDDPEKKKVQDRWEELRGELDGLREEGKKVYEERGALFDQRNALQKELNEIWEKKRASMQAHRDAGDAYRKAVDEDRRSKQEKFREQRAAVDAERQKEQITRMREDAKVPAFDREIEDCGVLINWFETKYGNGGKGEEEEGVLGAVKNAIEGVKQLALRQVDDQPAGTLLQKGKEEDETGWGSLAGGGGKKKKGGKKVGGAGTPATASGRATPATEGEAVTPGSVAAGGKLSIPYSTLHALLNFGITPPNNKEDVPRTVSDLTKKKEWYEANQERKTKEEVEKVEAQIRKMQKKSGGAAVEDAETELVGEVEEGGKKEPSHTVAVAGDAKHDLSVEQGEQLPSKPSTEAIKQLDGELEQVKSEEEAN